MPLPSLRLALLGWLLVPMGFLVAVNLWMTREQARDAATIEQDRLLLGSARIIGQQTHFEDELLQVVIPPAALELFRGSGLRDRVYYRVANASGTLLAGHTDLPSPPKQPLPEEAEWFNTTIRNQEVRVVAYAQPVLGAGMQGPVTIEVAQTQNALNRRVEQVLAQAFGQQLILLACAALLVWLVLRRGMASVMRLRDEVSARTPGTLKPLLTARVPRELHPLVVAINGYTDRLDRYQLQRAQFIADASHQLRTPLTVLNTQVTYALRTETPLERQEALLAIQNSVRHGTRIVNQMLSLSRVQAGSEKAMMGEQDKPDTAAAADVDDVADVALLAQDVLEQQAVFAQARQLDLGFERCNDNTEVSGSPLLIRELIANVLDNAIRYSHVGGQVNVSVGRSADTVVLQVADEGPGIPAQMRERVFERFYRIDPSRADGCGLGLSIVREIAATLGASVQLCEPKTGCGLLVEIRFVAAARNASDD